MNFTTNKSARYLLEKGIFRLGKKHQFGDPAILVAGLKAGASPAILYLQNKIKPSAIFLLQQVDLPNDLLQEALNETCIIFLKKLREPGFELSQALPTTYAIEICRRVVSNMTRRRNSLNLQPLEYHADLHDQDAADYNQRKENVELLTLMLRKLGDPCATVIRLKHLDGYSDEEVVHNKMVAYSTVESLRMKRSDCMKKLKEQAEKLKNL